MKVLGWSFNDNVKIGGIELSFYIRAPRRIALAAAVWESAA
jgi:hypothetical protein